MSVWLVHGVDCNDAQGVVWTDLSTMEVADMVGSVLKMFPIQMCYGKWIRQRKQSNRHSHCRHLTSEIVIDHVCHSFLAELCRRSITAFALNNYYAGLLGRLPLPGAW